MQHPFTTTLKSVGLAALLAILATGCAPSAPAKSDASASGSAGDSADCADGPVELSVWSWRPEDAKAYDRIFNVFEESHPCITVQFQAFKNTEYPQILQTGLGGADGPDVAQVRSYGQLQPFIESGKLLQLDDVVPALSEIDTAMLDGARSRADGHVYGVPFATQTLQVYYNKNIFAEHKLTPPTTWAEFEKLSDTLLEKQVTPIAFGAKDAWTIPLVHEVFGSAQYGGTDFETALLDGSATFEDPAYVASIETFAGLKRYMPKDVVGVSYTDAQVLFTSEQAAMFPGGSFELGFFTQQNPDLELGVFQVPPPPGSALGTPVSPSFADGNWAVSSGSPKQDQARTLVNWMASKEFGQLVVDELKQFSPIPGVSFSDPVMKDIWALYTKQSSPYILLVDFRYGQPSGSDLMGENGQKLLLGEIDAATVAKQIQTGVSQWFTPGK